MDVVRDNDKIWIDGALGFSTSEFASSPHGCQARMLQAIEHPLTYDDLICYSGFAFRINVHDGLCPSSAHPVCGYVCIDGSSRALPWNMNLFKSVPWGEPKDDPAAFEAQVCLAIKDSIDRGVPVHYGSEEDGLIVGYADEGRRWWCVHPYYKQGATAFWHDEAEGFAGGRWPWGIVVWTEPKPAKDLVSERELTAAALKQTVEMWNTDKRDAYFVGDAAYEQWLGWLRDVDEGVIEDLKPGMQGNGWCFDVLVHSRRIAGRWLATAADLFEDQAAADLRVAADRYTALADGCIAGLECPWDLAPGPDNFANWTSEMRQDQMQRLSAAREHDRVAVASTGSALEAMA